VPVHDSSALLHDVELFEIVWNVRQG
jgi:hypothetical protein